MGYNVITWPFQITSKVLSLLWMAYIVPLHGVFSLVHRAGVPGVYESECMFVFDHSLHSSLLWIGNSVRRLMSSVKMCIVVIKIIQHA